MIKDKQVEKRDNANVKLTVTLDKEYVSGEYDKLLKDYAKKAHIKGFRPGKVPPKVLEAKYGESLKAETAQTVLEEALKSVFEEIEEKPLPYSQPALEEEPELSFDSDMSFAVTYDVFPEVEPGEYTGHTVEEPQVKITDEDIQRELEAIQEQNAITMDKDSGVVARDDVITVDYVELDEEGNEREDTRRKDYTFTVGTEMNLYKFDDDVVDMKLDESKDITKTFPEDFGDESLAGTTRTIRVTVTAVKQRDLPEIDDELAQDVSDEYETLDDLKSDIRKRLEKQVTERVRKQKVDQLTNAILEQSTVPVPESMVKAELEQNWRNFLGQFGGNEQQIMQLIEAQGRTKEDFLEQWREQATARLRQQLLTQKLVESEGIEVSDEEVDEYIAEQAEGSSMSPEEAKEHYRNNNMLDYVKQEVSERKLFDKLFEQNKVKKGKKQSVMDVMGQNE
ncbi:MAG: trigger factor [Spirochaetales bacterium]